MKIKLRKLEIQYSNHINSQKLPISRDLGHPSPLPGIKLYHVGRSSQAIKFN